MAVNDIVMALLFVVPGFVTLSIVGVLKGVRKRADFEFLYQSIVISFLINMGFLLCGNNVVSILNIAEKERMANTLHLALLEILIAVLLGIIIVCFTRWHFRKDTLETMLFRFLKIAKLTDRIDTGKVWESVCLGRQENKDVAILLSSNLVAKGALEYISDDPSLREITLRSVVLLDAISGEIIGYMPTDKKYYMDLSGTLGLFYPSPE